MRVRGEDVASSVRDWLKEDIRKGPSLKHELGKFFAGVSTGSLTLFATLLKFAVKDPSLDRLTVGCFAAFLASTVLALYMAIPYVVRIREGLELYDEYNRIIRSIIALMGTWFGLWVVGFALGIAKLFGV
jgi:hypothetical protein